MPSEGVIWVTGGSGFFGQHIVRRIGPKAVTSTREEVDLRNLGQVEAFLQEHAVEAIVHAAARVGGIQYHIAHPGLVVVENLQMGMNVLEAASRIGKPHVVLISSACVYDDATPIPMAETAIHQGSPSGATRPYGVAKRALHTVAEGMRAERNLPSTVLVPINLYGPGDHFEEDRSHVVPALLKRAIDAKAAGADELVVWGDGTATRDFLYVEDAAEGVARALEVRPNGEEINLGSGRETTIRELAETIVRIVGFEGRLVFDAEKPGGSPRRALDPSKAAGVLGFRAKTSLEEGLRKTLASLEKG